MITVYDHRLARLVDCSQAELILVDASLGMVIQSKELTSSIELMIVAHAFDAMVL